MRLKQTLLLLACLFPFYGFAQDQEDKDKPQTHHEMGVNVGVANYYGDLQHSFVPSYGYKPMIGIIYKYFVNSHVGLRFGATYTNLTAADSLSNIPADKARNLSFATHLAEVNGALEINFLPVEIMKSKFSPYIFGGLALFYFNPYAIDPQGNKVYLRPLSTEGEGLPMYPDRTQYSLVNIAFPFGGGFKFFIRKSVLLTTEVGYRYTNTDYLDDVSKTYVDLNTLQTYKGLIAREMSYRGNTAPGWSGDYPLYGFQRGDPKGNDWYWTANITATLYFRAFGNARDYLKTKCPAFFR